MSHCPLQCSTCRVEDKRDTKIRKLTTSQINTCELGAFPPMAKEDEDVSPQCKVNLTDLRRILHLSLAKGSLKRTL
jgi:hypothetical protein